MCLAVPGKVMRIVDDPLGIKMATVSFGGVNKEVCLACVPDVQVGEYVIVHAGFAISKLDAKEARETLAILREIAAHE